ncbi:hypothetical protein [Mesoaciditoga sp.]
MKFEISQEEINEFIGDKFGASVKVKDGKLDISAMMGTVKFTLFAPKVPLNFSEEVKFDVSMSLTVRMFLGRIRQEIEKRKLDEAITITPNSLVLNVGKIDNTFFRWLKNKSLKEIEFEDGMIRLKIE